MRNILLLFALFISLSSLSLTRRELNNDNFNAEIMQRNCYFVVSEPIQLGDGECTVGLNSVIDFCGGSFIGGKLNPNNCIIKAPDYCVFDGTEITGSFGNQEISVLWFGRVDKSDVAPLVNRALRIAKGATVNLGGKDYMISSSIIMDTKGQRLKHTGTLYLMTDKPAFDLRATFLDLDVHSISTRRSVTGTARRYCGTGIRFSGNVYHCNIKVNEINGTKVGMDFAPDLDVTNNGDATKYAGMQYCRIDFNRIVADTAFRFDLYQSIVGKPLNNTKKYQVWINENLITGGSIDANYGIFCTERPENIDTQGEINCNVFNFLTFEKIRKVPLTLRGMEKCYFRNVYFGDDGELPDTVIDVSNSTLTDISSASVLTPGQVIAGDNNYAVTVRGPIKAQSANNERSMYMSGMEIYSQGLWGRGPSTKYLTSGVVPFNMVNTVDFKDSDVPVSTTVTVNDLMAKTTVPLTLQGSSNVSSFDQQILCSTCILDIGKNNKVYIDMESLPDGISAPLTLVVKTKGSNSYCYLIDNSLNIRKSVASGTYQLVMNDEFEWTLIELTTR